MPSSLMSPTRLALLLAGAALLLPASPAVAYVNDVVPRFSTSEPSSEGRQGRNLFCNVSPDPLSAGLTLDQLPNLAIQGAQVFYSKGNGAVLTGVETDPVEETWSLRQEVICAETDAPQPTVASSNGYVKGVQLVTAHSPLDSSTSKQVTATCPAGKRVIAGGGDVDGTEDIALTSLRQGGPGGSLLGADPPAGGATPTYTARAREMDATSNTWQVEAKAICANLDTTSAASDYADAVNRVTAEQAISSSAFKQATASCNPGQKVIGGGAQVLAGNQAADGTQGVNQSTRDVALTRSQPKGDSGNAQAWVAEAQETDPTNDVWGLEATAICAALDRPPLPEGD